MAPVFDIEIARQARIARQTRCHYIELKPISSRKVKKAGRAATVRQHGKEWL